MGGNLTLKDGVTSIGRGNDNDIILEGESVSRYHCRIASGDDGFSVQDLNSFNGTQVNGIPVRDSSPLRDMDAITVGEFLFEFRAPSEG